MFVWGDWRVWLIVLGCLPISGILMSVAMAAMMPSSSMPGTERACV
eukprot:CAMPEP_0119386014 /NCGR_PEP_ID=MMETSP1334-20130426/94021_1 /TAXON_ID=127549 /ORGANISM="Calcidiscus leptoporus, Strain RCC1130" /LENGTH=45 /DNA_ID= /DNA_START= /DNA_END= /DNA_ORIENTATION=